MARSHQIFYNNQQNTIASLNKSNSSCSCQLLTIYIIIKNLDFDQIFYSRKWPESVQKSMYIIKAERAINNIQSGVLVCLNYIISYVPKRAVKNTFGVQKGEKFIYNHAKKSVLLIIAILNH